MSAISDLVDLLINRENGAVSFQAGIREFLNDDERTPLQALEDVAIVLGTYRDSRETAIQDTVDQEAKLQLRKAVNNVVGDTVRICREWCNKEYTIKCKQKKPKYVYAVEKVEPKPEAEPEVSETLEPMEIPFAEEVSKGCAEKVAELVKEYSIEEVGGALAEIIKAAKAAEE